MHHILMVDDEPDIDILALQKFRKEIQAQSFKFSFARNGQHAIDVINAHPDIVLVVTDINMPQMNGYELLAYLKKHHPTIKTIIISAYSDTESMTLAEEGGADGFSPKPIDFIHLKEMLQRLLMS